jgi:GT2 family glycosyltransferase
MAQGATQFCRKDVFLALGGYDETLYMGEDVDLHWRLKGLAARRRGSVSFIEDLRVKPSTRRFDRWGLWRTLVWTNPLFILLFRRRKAAWRGWYDEAPR